MTFTKRIVWIDLAKAIAIVLMVIGHSAIPEGLSKWIFSFHMPFFFFVSGLFLNTKKDSFRHFLRKRLYSLIIPWILCSLIVLPLYLNFTDRNLSHFFKFGWDIALWFVPVLFLTEISYYLLFNRGNIYFKLALCGLLAFLLYKVGFHTVFKVENIFLALVFFGVGQKNKKLIMLIPHLDRRSYYLLFLFSGFGSICLSQILNNHLDMAHNYFDYPFLRLFNAFLGILFLFTLCLKLERIECLNRFGNFLGNNTFAIMAFSQIIMMGLIIFFKNFQLIKIYSLGIRFLLMWLILVFIIIITNKFFPIMIGKYNFEK